MRFKLLGAVSQIEKIAEGRGIRILPYLNRTYGKGRWRKLKGVAPVELEDGTIRVAEITGMKLTASAKGTSRSRDM